MKRARLLVVDDHAEVVNWLAEELMRQSYDVTGCTTPLAALDALGKGPHDLLIADIEMPGMRGLDLMEAARSRCPGLPVILITAFGSIELAVQAVRAGAADFVTKPFTIEVLLLAVERALRERTLRQEVSRLRRSIADDTSDGIVARSGAMRTVIEQARRAARTDSSVLLTGETGTGKGILAGLIHTRSRRSRGNFVQVNCAALPPSLVESELFGVKRGAFTGAREDREGLFSRAHNGTLFLDEVGELPLEVQPKLLQALELGRVRPLGSSQERTVDVRVVAATNRPLEAAVRDRGFRADLLFRLDVVRIVVPPLRERPEDIAPLVDHLMDRIGARLGRRGLLITEEALRALMDRPWHGNVRELSNVLERAIALSDDDTLTTADFADRPSLPDEGILTSGLASAATAGRTLDQVELAYLEAMRDACAGNMSEAARKLGIDRRTLYRKLDRGGG